MNNKKQQARTLLSLAMLGGLITATGHAHAGGFSTPTFGAPGWGRALFNLLRLRRSAPTRAYL
ncbi:hypothetical protein [Pseudomonas sp. PA-1-5A]|uniref:hypothetical protein n=1 Tax=Pseudomonas sp. PA-1-5A TaxID=2665466 RepID=UPI001F3FA00C|nr:hypothetical protein [Pseudomonas sp. PA-1-5A]